MAQPSIANYFNTRKRGAVEESRIIQAKKVLLLDENNDKTSVRNLTRLAANTDLVNNNFKIREQSKVKVDSDAKKSSTPVARKKATPSRKKVEQVPMGNIQDLLNNMGKSKVKEPSNVVYSENTLNTPTPASSISPTQPATPTKNASPVKCHNVEEPLTPSKLNAMDRVRLKGTEPTLAQLQHKLSRSSRLAELRASIARFKQSEKKLEVAEKTTQQLKDSPSLKSFKSIELEVNVSPQKPQSPQKQYLSPKKDTSVRRNLFNLQSPTKNALHMPPSTAKEVSSPVKDSLTLPYKYRYLAEIFRSIDTVSQILFNRKETITFRKLKAAVEEMLKRNLTEKHLGQIKSLYPDSFELQWEKLREFGTGTRKERWELVVTPKVGEHSTLTSEQLLERRRCMFKILIEKVKDYHQEFLLTLDPPMEIARNKIARWHPLFDIEKVPDVEAAGLPPAPCEEKLTTGSEVLEKARAMFNCNTRMERALDKLKDVQATETIIEEPKHDSILKGIPKALLEKVRQKQAAKAFESMTRSADKEKEVQLYSRLPEVARLARNLFVSEKKSVLQLEVVLDKLCNSYRVYSSKTEMEVYLKTIVKEVNDWMVFHEVRGVTFVKIAKAADLSLVVNKLQSLVDQKKLP